MSGSAARWWPRADPVPVAMEDLLVEGEREGYAGFPT